MDEDEDEKLCPDCRGMGYDIWDLDEAPCMRCYGTGEL
jgi:DnaJ-class molecular chaperone